MKAKIISFSATGDYEQLVEARKKATGLSRSEYFRKCIREEAERAVSARLNITELLLTMGRAPVS